MRHHKHTSNPHENFTQTELLPPKIILTHTQFYPNNNESLQHYSIDIHTHINS